MYKLMRDDLIKNLTTGAIFPEEPGNRDYDEYLLWVAAGNTPEPADPDPGPPPGEIAGSGAKQWFIDNPATQQLFTLTIPELETEINTLVDALFPAATAQNRTKTKKFWMSLAVTIRVLVRREFG